MIQRPCRTAARRRSGFVFATLVAVACTLHAASRAVADDERKPDIVLIMIDTLRAERLGCYGNPTPASPSIDAIAESGLRFDEAVSTAPWTCPSVATVFTALYPSEHRVLDHAGRYRGMAKRAVTDVLDSELTTLAEGLSSVGYETAGFVANRWMAEEFGFAQGFAHWDHVEVKQRTASAALVNERVFEFLAKRKSTKPLFLYVHYMDVHGPYNAPGPYREQFVEPLRAKLKTGALTKLPNTAMRLTNSSIDIDRTLQPYREYWLARYDAGIRYCDDHIGELRDHLKKDGIWNDAWVFLTADHGEQFGEHGGGGHGSSVHSHQLNVPLIIKLPGSTKTGTVDATVSLISIAPTIWEIAGASLPSNAIGQSILPIIETPDSAKAAFAFGEGAKRNPNTVSAQHLKRKVIYDIRNKTGVYYDLRNDPFEQNPLDEPMDDVAAELLQNLNRWLMSTRENAPIQEAPKAEIDPETERLLRSLGYFSDDDDDSGFSGDVEDEDE